MITLNDIVSTSIPSFIDTLSINKNAFKLQSYVDLNMSWLQKFSQIIFSLNGDHQVCQNFINEFKIKYPNIEPILLLSESNLGHTFGILDTDRQIYEYCRDTKNRDIQYVWKFSGDVIANDTIFDIEIDDSCDFFYINNVGTPSLINTTKEQLLEDMMSQKYFYPQTNYYIYKNKIQRWYPPRDNIIKLKNMYDEIKKEHPNYYPWDAISKEDAGLPADANSGCACEAFLAQTVIENNLKKQCLLSREDTKKILDLIDEYRIGDGSHKNILYTNVGGLCHYHIMNGQAVPI